MAQVTNKQEQQVEVKVPCLVYSRVVGYLTPVSQWNTGKKQEWNDRKTYHVPRSNNTGQVPDMRQASSEQASE